MVSTLKALVSLSISLLVSTQRFILYDGIESMDYIIPVLILYCFADLNNRINIIIHHIATILLNTTFLFVLDRKKNLEEQEFKNVETIILSFFDVEVSTIFLSLINLGFKNSFVKQCFFMSFLYFRIIAISCKYYLYFDYKYIEKICQNNQICYNSWNFGAYPLIFLNYYWIILLVKKILKDENKSKIKNLKENLNKI